MAQKEYYPSTHATRDVDITFADITKAEQLLNYHPTTELALGITKFIEWYKPLPKISRQY